MNNLKICGYLFIISGIVACQVRNESGQNNVPDQGSNDHQDEYFSIYSQDLSFINTDKQKVSDFAGMVKIEGGSFMMGGDNDQAQTDEFPKHKVKISSFWIDVTEVTNAQFKAFVDATGYVTTAERAIDLDEIMRQLPPGTEPPPPELLEPASMVFVVPETFRGYQYVNWWELRKGANWSHPEGPESSIQEIGNHPVVHVSFFDALAYCKWSGKRLPTEAEWEYAARGGLKDKIYPWGDEPPGQNVIKANYWQGEFPMSNSLSDKYLTTSPVKIYPPNGYGLYDIAGNVWEWTADWYRHDYYQFAKDNRQIINPQGPTESLDPNDPTVPKRVLRGGSFLSNDNYSSGYRVSARMKVSEDTGLQHSGFRCVRDITPNN